MRENLALMQYHEVIAGDDLVEQMGGPQHADALFGDQLADMAENIGSRLDVEADRRLVKQQQARTVQQGARDFQPPHLAAREVAHLAAGAVGKADARQHFTGAQARLAPIDAVQGSMIQQILRDREIEVERARLEHHAQQPQRFAGLKADVVAEDTDASGLDAEQPRDQREQGAFASAVEAKQRREACRRDGEVDVDEGASDAIGMADAIDRQRGHFGRTAAAATVRRGRAGEGRVGRGHGCAIAMPQGSSPTWIVLITFCATTSIIETSLDTPLVTSRYFSSGVNAMCQTRWPTRRYLVTKCLAPSTIAIRFAGPSAMKPVLPSLVMPMPTGWIASRRMPGMLNVILPVTVRFAGSMTDTVPPISEDTHSSEPSRLNSAKRGRASTSTLATIWRVAVSMKCAMLVVSEVLIRIFPSGLMAMPSGSTPTWMSPTRTRFSRSIMVTVLSFSLAT